MPKISQCRGPELQKCEIVARPRKAHSKLRCLSALSSLCLASPTEQRQLWARVQAVGEEGRLKQAVLVPDSIVLPFRTGQVEILLLSSVCLHASTQNKYSQDWRHSKDASLI